MTESDPVSRRLRLAAYWNEQRTAIPRARKRIWERRLDTQRVLAQASCLTTGQMLLMDAIDLILIDEDSLVGKFLDHAEFYIETAIARDEVGLYDRGGYPDLGRASRVRTLAITTWLKHGGALDLDAFRKASALERGPYERIFALAGWEKTGFDLSDWMLHLIIEEDPAEAARVYGKYLRGAGQRKHRATLGAPEEVLFEVAEHLTEDTDRSRAEEKLDAFHLRITDWESKRTLTEVLLDKKLLYAYVRGCHFKGVTDPVQLIKMMKFGE